MKKFILYFLLLLLIAGLATLTYGFYNAKNIRFWSNSAGQILEQYDISEKGLDAKAMLNDNGKRNRSTLSSDLEKFSIGLEAKKNDIAVAKNEIGKIRVPRNARNARQEVDEFFAKSEKQAMDISGIVKFLNQTFKATEIFDKMKTEMSIEEIRELAGGAKSRSAEIDTTILPEGMIAAGNDLKVSTESYLDILDQIVSGKSEDSNQLNLAYADFSEKLNSFLLQKDRYVGSYEDLRILRGRIDSDLAILGNIRFSLN